LVNKSEQKEIVMLKRSWWICLVSGLIILSLNMTTVLIAKYVFGASLELYIPGTGNVKMTVLNLIPESFVIPVVAAILVYLFGKFFKRPLSILLVVIAVIFLLTINGPIRDGVGLPTKIALALTHFNIALVIILMNIFFCKTKS
jgi:hypothetical protein